MQNVSVFIFILLFSNNLFAEPKSLVCTSPADVGYEAYMKKYKYSIDQVEQWKVFKIKVYREENVKLHSENAVKAKVRAGKCKTTGFQNKFTFTFDTEGFKNSALSKAEYYHVGGCGYDEYPIKETKISVTPNILTFHVFFRPVTTKISDVPGTISSFNIDRKSLSAGIATDRNYACVIKDINTSDNKI